MKAVFFSWIFSFVCLGGSFAQNVKLYGYVQKSTPGIKAAREIDESGNVKKTTTEPNGGTYYMYIVSPKKARIYLVEGWLKGERIGLKAEPVDAPVNVSGDGTEEKTLVPEEGKGQVSQLTGTKAIPGKDFPKAKVLAQKADLVVVYKLNGKFGYATVKELTKLPTGHLQ